nr:hypothetical protein [Tanacetum cinerariifolium]
MIWGCYRLASRAKVYREPDYIPDLEEPQTPPAPQEKDEHEPMFIQVHDPDFMPEPIYPEYIPLEDEHILLAEEQLLPPVVSPTAESQRYVAESDPKEDPEEYEDDKTEDGPVDYPMDGGDDGDEDDSDSSVDNVDDEDEDEEEIWRVIRLLQEQYHFEFEEDKKLLVVLQIWSLSLMGTDLIHSDLQCLMVDSWGFHLGERHEIPLHLQSLSSGFANQFLLNSPNASFLGTIIKPVEGGITSMINVHIQQDVPTVVREPFHTVIVSVILETTQATPPPPPPTTTITLATQVPNTEAVSFVVQRFSEMEHFVKKLKETNFNFATPIIEESVKAHAVNEDVIEESVKAHVVNEVKNFLPQFLPMKSSTPKESSRGKPPSKPSKSRKTRSADDNVEDTVIEIGSDDVDQIFDKKADDSEQPSPNANTEKPSLVVAPKPKR